MKNKPLTTKVNEFERKQYVFSKNTKNLLYKIFYIKLANCPTQTTPHVPINKLLLATLSWRHLLETSTGTVYPKSPVINKD